jgi:hypothetical protein
MAEVEHRAGMIWFTLTRHLLRREWDIWRLLASWGGEGIYWLHERDSEANAELCAIGVPCVVQLAVDVAALSLMRSVADRMVDGFLHRRRVSTEHGYESMGNVRQPIPPDQIIRITRGNDPEFATLTGCRKWVEPLGGGAPWRPRRVA